MFLQAAELAHKAAEQRRRELQVKVRSTKETIASTNTTIQKLEREMNMEQDDMSKPEEPSPSASTVNTATPKYVDVSDSESMANEQAYVAPGDSLTNNATTSQTAKISHVPEYEMISDVDSVKSSVSHASLKPPSIVVEPISDSEEQQPYPIQRHPSPISVELVSDAENDIDKLSTQAFPFVQYELIVENVSDVESIAGDSLLKNPEDLIKLEHNYCAAGCDAPHLEPASNTIAMPSQEPLAAVCEGESPINTPTPPVAEPTPLSAQPGELDDPSFIVEQATVEVPQNLVYDVAQPAVGVVTAHQTMSLLPKKVFRKSKESPKKGKSPAKEKQSRLSLKRKASSHVRYASNKRPKSIPLQKQHSLPASTNQGSSLECAISQAINAALCPALSLIVSPPSYSSLMQSSSLPTPNSTHNGTTSAPAILDNQQGSGSSRVPGILTNLVTSFTTEIMQNGGAVSPSESSTSGDQQDTHGNRLPGILNNLVTYLTTETIQNAVATSPLATQTRPVDSASNLNTVSVVQEPMSLSQDSESAVPSSGCEASEEYESDEGPRREGRGVYIDADSLFHPRTDALFTLSDQVPPLFILPRLASAGDFPLEVDPSAISSVALDAVRQGIIHAPPNSELSSDVTESEMSTGELSDNSSSTGVKLGAKVQMKSPLTESQLSIGRGSKEQENSTKPSVEQLESSVQPSSTKTAAKSGKTVMKQSQQAKVKRSSTAPTKPQKSTTPSCSKLAKLPKSSKKLSLKSSPMPTSSKSTTASLGVKVTKGVGGTQVRGKGNTKLQQQLKKHMARLEELKGHLASKSSQPTSMTASAASSSTNAKASSQPSMASQKAVEKPAVLATTRIDRSKRDEPTCARTSAYKATSSHLKGMKGRDKVKSTAVKVSTTGSSVKRGKLTVEKEMNEIAKFLETERRRSDVSSVSDVSAVRNLLWQSSQQLLELEPHPLPVVAGAGSSVSCQRLIIPLAVPSSCSTLSEKVIVAMEKLEKQKKQMASSLYHTGGAPPTQKQTAYCPYSSPLLMFQSYRLNPHYRTNEKLSLQSLSHSNKMNPNRIMCRFELGGICNDSSCSGQHFKDIRLSKEELIEDLVCYAPQLADCSDTQKKKGSTAELHREAKEKISLYSSKMVERYSSKVSDEDLFKLTVHDVNKERAKLRTDPKARANYISFDDRIWLRKKEGDVSIKHPISLLARESLTEGTKTKGDDDTAVEDGAEMEWDSVSAELMPLGSHGLEARYVTMLK